MNDVSGIIPQPGCCSRARALTPATTLTTLATPVTVVSLDKGGRSPGATSLLNTDSRAVATDPVRAVHLYHSDHPTIHPVRVVSLVRFRSALVARVYLETDGSGYQTRPWKWRWEANFQGRSARGICEQVGSVPTEADGQAGVVAAQSTVAGWVPM